MAAGGGVGSSGRRYQATVEVEWADEKYPLECIKDSCGRVSVALKELRNIVCRSRANPEATQLGAEQLCVGPLFKHRDSQGTITFGTQHDKTMISADKALYIAGFHAHKYMMIQVVSVCVLYIRSLYDHIFPYIYMRRIVHIAIV